MKMEIPVEAPAAGRVVRLLVHPEDVVAEDQLLAVLESD
jgi:biotin carboxyl carrier protein